jgi:DNA-binding FadR family transcriptional regulator
MAAGNTSCHKGAQMQEPLEPLQTNSLKEVFVQRFEDLILSGQIAVGQKLPSERELALQLGVSRPVVHEGLVVLEAKGLVKMVPRVGTVVNDFRSEGSLALLTSLVQYQQGRIEPELLESLLQMRLLFETEAARMAASARSEDQLAAFDDLLAQEAQADPADVKALSALDFQFHHLVSMASGNLVYPLLLNSFKGCYLNLARQFFTEPAVVSKVFDYHNQLVAAIASGDGLTAADIVTQMLKHGALHLKAQSA